MYNDDFSNINTNIPCDHYTLKSDKIENEAAFKSLNLNKGGIILDIWYILRWYEALKNPASLCVVGVIKLNDTGSNLKFGKGSIM